MHFWKSFHSDSYMIEWNISVTIPFLLKPIAHKVCFDKISFDCNFVCLKFKFVEAFLEIISVSTSPNFQWIHEAGKVSILIRPTSLHILQRHVKLDYNIRIT